MACFQKIDHQHAIKLSLHQTMSKPKPLLPSHYSGSRAEDETNTVSIVDAVRDHFDVKDRQESFLVHYKTDDESREIRFELKGVKRRLGQTLSSTGLTM